MIQTNPNPKMTSQEVTEFRSNMRKCIERSFTNAEKAEIEIRKDRINKVGKSIIKNNGGKNPILER